MKNKRSIKRIIAGMLALVITLTAIMPASIVKAETAKASLDSLGKLGTVNIGSKSESGTWLQTLVDDNPVFCLDLGKACHTGYTYESSSKTISSDDSNKKNSLEAKIGYWYYQTKKQSNKAWVYAQCLIWGVEEGVASESGLKDIISQVKKNTGYYSDDNIYSDIFGIDKTVSCNIKRWKYKGTTDEDQVQELMEIIAPKEIYDFYPIKDSKYYRQRITLQKNDEDGKGIPKVSFRITAKNIKEMYSYQFNGWGDAVTEDVDSDATKFVQDVLTDSTGKIIFRFTYLLTSKKYYYVPDAQLDEMSASDKKAMKDKLDDKGYHYASDLSKSGAEKLINADLDDQMDDISNGYVLEELSSNNGNIMSEFTVTSGAGKVTSQSSNKVTITLTKADSWTKNKDGKWPETAEESYSNYKLAYKPVFEDKFKKVKFVVTKKDAENNSTTAQGDATLAGAVYGVYSDSACTKLLDTYKTGTDCKFETKYYRCGQTFYLKEITPPEGYLKNDKVYTIVEDGAQFSAEYNQATRSADETPIKGRVSIIKGKGDGTAGIVDKEINAQFEVFLASSGSYAKAKATERDILKTDKDGYAITKELPYGTYIVHQISGDDETQFCPDFSVDVKKNGETYKYLLNNPEFTAYLKIVKKDSKTKQTVLKSGTTYQIYKLAADGTETLVKQSYNNGNKIVVVDKFVTDESGEIITYQKLKAGSYRVYEVNGPSGFKNAKKFINIQITNKSYKTMVDEDGNEYLYAEYYYYNDETYGKFTVKKTGPSVIGFDNTEKENPFEFNLATDLIPKTNEVRDPFIYENIALNDVVFELYAKEDVVTQDGQGTTWFNKGDLVATITTGKGAEFSSNCEGICSYSVDEFGFVTLNVPLGAYEIKETKTIYGYVLPEVASWNLNFVWNSQDDDYVLDISENTIDGDLYVANDLVSTDITVKKADSKTEKPIPNTTFGFYTKDNIYDREGNVILEADSKITTVTTGADGTAKIPFNVPVMSEDYGEVEAPLNSGDYYFLEESISDSYYVAEDPAFVHLEYQDQETATVCAEAVVSDEQTEVVVDKLMIASSVEVKDCHLKISDTDGNEIISWITGDAESIKVNENLTDMGYVNFDACLDENGSIKVNGLLHDKEYILTETKPADGYVTASDISFMIKQKVEAAEFTQEVLIKNGEEFVGTDSNKVVMYDDTTKMEFSKLSITDGQELPGCKMKVTEKESGEVMDEWTSTEFSHVIEGKYVVGKTYILSETKPADGYATATDVEFTVQDDGKVQKVSMVDDTTKVEFSKLASDTKKQLKGAKYKVYNSKGKKVYEFTTGKKAEMIEGVFKVGETYTFKEVDAPEHYKLAKDKTITIKDTGNVQKLTAVDIRIPEVPDTPQTGFMNDTTRTIISLLSLLLAAICVVCVRAKDKSKYNFNPEDKENEEE